MSIKRWYAVYTKSRAEKKVNELLVEKGICVYLPLLKVLKQWSDRKKLVSEPLFKSYVFVYAESSEFLSVLETYGVVCFVKIGRELVAIPENQINAIKFFLQEKAPKADTFLNDLIVGQEVEILQGPMQGLSGIITHSQGNNKLRVKIEAINDFINFTLPRTLLAPISNKVTNIV